MTVGKKWVKAIFILKVFYREFLPWIFQAKLFHTIFLDCFSANFLGNYFQPISRG